MSMTIAVFGLNQIQAAITADLEKKKAQIDAEIQYAGVACQAYAKQNCPVDTGRLRSSIQYVNLGQMSCQTSTDVSYGPDIEFGHLTRNHSTYVAPQPFLRPAYEQAKQELVANLKAM